MMDNVDIFSIHPILQSFARTRAHISPADVLRSPEWPETWPFVSEHFSRQDETDDSRFYSDPRMVFHIDDSAIEALTSFYKETIPKGSAVLDICSSWVSHYPTKYLRTVGVGMNEFELSQNPQLDEYVAKDLNVDPILPFDDNTFDFITLVVSVDYLTRPLEVFTEINRVLKSGGKALISQSNRCFPTKAIKMWLNTNDLQHIYIVGSYFHYAGGFLPPECIDISPQPQRSDPMFIIQATKA